MSNLFGVYFSDVLKEMCSRVGADYDSVDFQKDGWYLDHTWTTEEQEDFVSWFAAFLKNTGPRTEMCKYPQLVKTTEERKRFARKFISEFGWLISKTKSKD